MNLFRRVWNAGAIRTEKAALLQMVRDAEARGGGINIQFRDVTLATSEQERRELQEKNEITKVALSQLLYEELWGKYESNDHGMSITLMPKVRLDKLASAETVNRFRSIGGLYDGKYLVEHDIEKGDLPVHRFRNMPQRLLNGAPDENVWAEEEARAAARREERRRYKQQVKATGGLVDASGAPVRSKDA